VKRTATKCGRYLGYIDKVILHLLVLHWLSNMTIGTKTGLKLHFLEIELAVKHSMLLLLKNMPGKPQNH
jgi:hypothetical protein